MLRVFPDSVERVFAPALFELAEESGGVVGPAPLQLEPHHLLQVLLCLVRLSTAQRVGSFDLAEARKYFFPGLSDQVVAVTLDESREGLNRSETFRVRGALEQRRCLGPILAEQFLHLRRVLEGGEVSH